MKGARSIAAAFAVLAGASLVPTLAQQPPPGRAAQRGPLALVGGTLVDGTGTKGANPSAVQTLNVSGADDARAKTRQLIDQGVDWIKILKAEQLTPEEMKAIVDEAHARGRKVAAHAFSDEEIRRGLIAGVDDFQHLRTQTRCVARGKDRREARSSLQIGGPGSSHTVLTSQSRLAGA